MIGFLVVGVSFLLAIIGLIYALLSDGKEPKPDHSPYAMAVWTQYIDDQLEAEKRREEKALAWEWYRFCDAVHTDWLEKNPPSPRARVLVNERGMWVPIIYDGVRMSDLYRLAVSYDGFPKCDIPSSEQAWREIGPNEGFPTKAEAQRFLKSYLARKDAKAA